MESFHDRFRRETQVVQAVMVLVVNVAAYALVLAKPRRGKLILS